jgi:hypothetical protein
MLHTLRTSRKHEEHQGLPRRWNEAGLRFANEFAPPAIDQLREGIDAQLRTEVTVLSVSQRAFALFAGLASAITVLNVLNSVSLMSRALRGRPDVRRPSMLEQVENARWMRVQAEQCRASAYSTSEPEQRYTYIQLAECYEAQASECGTSTLLKMQYGESAHPMGFPRRISVPGALI